MPSLPDLVVQASWWSSSSTVSIHEGSEAQRDMDGSDGGQPAEQAGKDGLEWLRKDDDSNIGRDDWFMSGETWVAEFEASVYAYIRTESWHGQKRCLTTQVRI